MKIAWCYNIFSYLCLFHSVPFWWNASALWCVQLPFCWSLAFSFSFKFVPSFNTGSGWSLVGLPDTKCSLHTREDLLGNHMLSFSVFLFINLAQRYLPFLSLVSEGTDVEKTVANNCMLLIHDCRGEKHKLLDSICSVFCRYLHIQQRRNVYAQTPFSKWNRWYVCLLKHPEDAKNIFNHDGVFQR